MEHVNVKSSMIRSVAWEAGALEVIFNNGRTYRYDGVPSALYHGMVSEGEVSAGQYFNEHIKPYYNGVEV